MLSLPGRNGRRRRVLKDEVLSASSSHVALRAISDERDANHDAPRYSEAASVENHPQVTDFIPRRYRTFAMSMLAGALTTATLATLHYVAPTLAAAGLASVSPIDLAAPGSLASWISAVVLLIAAVTCILVYTLRRHRIDDFRGRYRVWLAAAAGCLVLSINSVAGIHGVVAQTLAHATGWTALRDGAAWWLVLGGVPLAWIALRTLQDVRECRGAVLLFAMAIAGYLVAAAGFLGLLPTGGQRVESLLTGSATLLANWLLLTAVAAYARFVVLDAQGLIPHDRRATKTRASLPQVHQPATRSSPQPAADTVSRFAAAGRSRPSSVAATPAGRSASASTEWIDGSRAERDRFDDDTDEDESTVGNKLSKSERKRLRKLKARHRAA